MSYTPAARIWNKLDRRELRVTYLVGLFLTMIAILVMVQNYFKYAHLGAFSIGLSLVYNLIVYATYASLTPFIFRFGGKFPIDNSPIWKNIIVHVFLSIGLGLAHMIFCNVLLYSIDLSSAIIFPRFITKYLTNVIHFHLIAYWTILLLQAYRKTDGTSSSEESKEVLERLKVEKNGRIYWIELDDIIWIQAMDHYQKVHTSDGYHLIGGSMKDLEVRLPRELFKRIHRSYIINISKIESLTNGRKVKVTLTNGLELSVGNSYKGSIRELI